MSANEANLREMRQAVFMAVAAAGMGEEVADSARLVASELVGNAVRACGPWAPVVVQVHLGERDVLVQVHDPDPAARPVRGERAPDNAEEVTGRGLWILDAIAPGWTVQATPLGKQVACTLPAQRGS
jgi:anti-sigma regulatory factor (Ser/Thr protein kinase)